jgi:hypothetical protein
VIFLFYVPYLHHEKSIPIIKRDELKQMIKKEHASYWSFVCAFNKIITWLKYKNELEIGLRHKFEYGI